MAANHNAVLSLAGTSISHTAYAQLVAATAIPLSKLVIANGTDQTVILAVGAAGSEVDIIAVGKGCTESVNFTIGQIPVGSRIALESVGVDCASGFYSVSLL